MIELMASMMRMTIAIAAMTASPKGLAAKFTHVVASEPAPCLNSEGMPPPMISRTSSISGLPVRRSSLTTPRRTANVTRMMKLMVWHTAVAMPAPAIPSPATKISNGATMKFSNAPLTRPIMPYSDSPWYRSRPLSANDPHTMGAAMRIGVR